MVPMIGSGPDALAARGIIRKALPEIQRYRKKDGSFGDFCAVERATAALAAATAIER